MFPCSWKRIVSILAGFTLQDKANKYLEKRCLEHLLESHGTHKTSTCFAHHISDPSHHDPITG